MAHHCPSPDAGACHGRPGIRRIYPAAMTSIASASRCPGGLNLLRKRIDLEALYFKRQPERLRGKPKLAGLWRPQFGNASRPLLALLRHSHASLPRPKFTRKRTSGEKVVLRFWNQLHRG